MAPEIAAQACLEPRVALQIAVQACLWPPRSWRQVLLFRHLCLFFHKALKNDQETAAQREKGAQSFEEQEEKTEEAKETIDKHDSKS